MREVSALREVVEQRIQGTQELLESNIGGTADVTDEKFDSIETQLALIERQRVEQKKDTKDAVDAALAAAKEAVAEQTTSSDRAIAKSETSFIESVRQLGEKFDTAFDGQRRETDDLKERMTKLESVRTGGQEAKSAITATTALVFAGLAGAVGLVGIIVAVVPK